jgi:hypothetical protein
MANSQGRCWVICQGPDIKSQITPRVAPATLQVATATDVIDTTRATVHMVVGGGTSVPSNQSFFNVGMSRDHRRRRSRFEDRRASAGLCQGTAPRSAARNAAHAYGFAIFTLDPSSIRAGATSIKVVHYDLVGPDGQSPLSTASCCNAPPRTELK